MNAVLIGVAAYIALQFVIGIWVARRISTESDFINAGRSLGPILGVFTVFATWFGAEAIVGAAGEVYREGLVGATIDPFGYAAGLIVAGVVLAVPLWTRGYLTFADFFRERYSPAVEQLAVLMILPGTIIWAGIQIRAFGQVMGAASDLPIVTSILVAAVLVVAYTALGGLLADAITDMVQGIAIILGLIVLFVLIVAHDGGLSHAFDRVPGERLAPIAFDLTV